ncbi:hypothetical protein PM082_009204 [Marasmius tenuissimus]|nr:hypothetical protein PM082_009204 [Marasmius tenuissimus]
MSNLVSFSFSFFILPGYKLQRRSSQARWETTRIGVEGALGPSFEDLTRTGDALPLSPPPPPSHDDFMTHIWGFHAHRPLLRVYKANTFQSYLNVSFPLTTTIPSTLSSSPPSYLPCWLSYLQTSYISMDNLKPNIGFRGQAFLGMQCTSLSETGTTAGQSVIPIFLFTAQSSFCRFGCPILIIWALPPLAVQRYTAYVLLMFFSCVHN